jgi:serine/threonine-protein kinase
MEEGSLVDGRYRVLCRLGEGAFGEVLEAEDENLGRRVALKLLKVSVADVDMRARFDREARVTAGLTHPNVVTLYGHGVAADGRPYLAYELLEGEDLESRQDKGEVTEDDALRWGVEVAGALQVAHEQGVIHRDVKPANVFLKQGGVAVLCDFGIARDSSGATALTSEGVLLGTPAYMSPELWRGKAPSPASDQWAWAASLFELVYAQVPYAAESPREIMEQGLSGIPVRVPAGYEGRRPGLQEVLLRGLAVRPEDRYPDMSAFGDALREAARGSLQDVLERSGVGVIPDPKVDSSRETMVLPPSATQSQALDLYESTPTRAVGEPQRIPRWVLVVGASAFMTLGILWPRGAAPEPPEVPSASPTPEAPAPEVSAKVPPEVLERLAPLRRELLGAGRELKRLIGVHPSEPLPDRLVRLTFQPTERMQAIDPPSVGQAILQNTSQHELWRVYLEAATAWVRALGDEQRRGSVDLLADPGVVASIEALLYRPVLRLLEAAHLFYVQAERSIGMDLLEASQGFLALGPAYEEFIEEVRDAWGGGELPPALANLEDLGNVLGRYHWTQGPTWDATDRRQLLHRLQDRVAQARPDPVGAMVMRLTLYHLCLIAKHVDAPWGERDAVLTTIATKLLEDPAWRPPAAPAPMYRGLLGRLLLEEVRQRRVRDAPTKLGGHPERRTKAVLMAFEAIWEEDPTLAFHVGAMGWDLARYSGGPSFFNKENNETVRPLKRRIEAFRNEAHERARPGTNRRGDKRVP